MNKTSISRDYFLFSPHLPLFHSFSLSFLLLNCFRGHKERFPVEREGRQIQVWNSTWEKRATAKTRNVTECHGKEILDSICVSLVSSKFFYFSSLSLSFSFFFFSFSVFVFSFQCYFKYLLPPSLSPGTSVLFSFLVHRFQSVKETERRRREWRQNVGLERERERQTKWHVMKMFLLFVVTVHIVVIRGRIFSIPSTLPLLYLLILSFRKREKGRNRENERKRKIRFKKVTNFDVVNL